MDKRTRSTEILKKIRKKIYRWQKITQFRLGNGMRDGTGRRRRRGNTDDVEECRKLKTEDIARYDRENIDKENIGRENIDREKI